MYFPSESWGRMRSGKDSDAIDVETYLFDRLIRLEFGEEDNFAYLDELVEAEFDSNHFFRSKRFLQEVLEECIMPILNPKTGEEDYVDTSKIEQILIEPQELFDLLDGSTYEIPLKLRYDSEKEKVELIGKPKFLEDSMGVFFSIELLERLLQESIVAEEDKRLEDFDEFKALVTFLMEDIIKEGKQQEKQLIKPGLIYSRNEGLGLIVDPRTKYEVGTFEKLEMQVENSSLKVRGFHIITQGKSLSQDSESLNDYHYIFYSLSDHKIYEFSSSKSITIEEGEHESESVLTIEDPELLMTDFDETNFKYPTILEAQNKKRLIQDLDLQDVLNKMSYENFKSSRLEILAKSREQAKKEAIYNRFSDIELEL